MARATGGTSRRAPLIGITCEAIRGRAGFRDYALHCDHRYAEAVKEAGGHPILLPIADHRSATSSGHSSGGASGSV